MVLGDHREGIGTWSRLIVMAAQHLLVGATCELDCMTRCISILHFAVTEIAHSRSNSKRRPGARRLIMVQLVCSMSLYVSILEWPCA